MGSKGGRARGRRQLAVVDLSGSIVLNLFPDYPENVFNCSWNYFTRAVDISGIQRDTKPFKYFGAHCVPVVHFLREGVGGTVVVNLDKFGIKVRKKFSLCQKLICTNIWDLTRGLGFRVWALM